MCFSASASFIASGGLIALGGASLKVASKKEKILAAIPFIFGIQQAFEGIQWFYLDANNYSLFAGYVFLFFAFIVWPIYVPTAVFVLDKKRRKILKPFIFLGSIVAIYFLYFLMNSPLAIRELNACVDYTLKSPFVNFVNVLYSLVVFVPLLISSHKIFRLFGIVVFVSAVVTWFFFIVNFISVWCFFAAIVSSMFFVYLKSKKKKTLN